MSEPNWNPMSLLSLGTFVMWTAFGVALFLLAVVALAVVLIVKAAKRKAGSEQE